MWSVRSRRLGYEKIEILLSVYEICVRMGDVEGEESKMNVGIREMVQQDKETVLQMMRVFYSSSAVWTNGSEEIFLADIENCVGDCPFLEGYVFQEGDEIQGYAMVAKSFSTEFGKPCMWIEDLYMKPAYRGLGIGSLFFHYLEEKYKDVIFRLEVEKENTKAIGMYEKNGYAFLPYAEMKK